MRLALFLTDYVRCSIRYNHLMIATRIIISKCIKRSRRHHLNSQPDKTLSRRFTQSSLYSSQSLQLWSASALTPGHSHASKCATFGHSGWLLLERSALCSTCVKLYIYSPWKYQQKNTQQLHFHRTVYSFLVLLGFFRLLFLHSRECFVNCGGNLVCYFGSDLLRNDYEIGLHFIQFYW